MDKNIRSLLILISFLWISSILNAQTVTFTGAELLGKPTNNSITINIIPDDDIEYYYEYGTTSGVYTHQTHDAASPAFATGGDPHEIVISGLQINTRYYYRMRYRVPGGSWNTRTEYSFMTQRTPGSTFVFTITSDSHAQFTLNHRQAMINIDNDNPDFNIDLGDTFYPGDASSQIEVDAAYLAYRDPLYMGRIGPSVPIFLTAGNHEDEEGWNLDDTPFSSAVGSIQARKAFYPTPVPDGFYSGDDSLLSLIDEVTYGDEYRENYYAWEWGDALFVILDEFQYTMLNPYGAIAGEGTDDPDLADQWIWTLGAKQFKWFREIIQNSNAKYKFVFSHNMVGGIPRDIMGFDAGYVRGGAEAAAYFEWGGKNYDGTEGFASHRDPADFGTIPIHQLMVENGVSAYFHGHDHQYAYEIRDGIVYQEVPSPSMTGSGFSGIYTEGDYGDYQIIEVLPNAGHLRLTISPDEATVEYVRSNQTGVSHTYTIEPNADPTDPNITITGDPLADFSSEPGTPSAEQSYLVSGSNLTDDISITAPADFEISITSGSGWTSSLTLTQSGGSVPETDIYVRFNRSNEGTSSGDIVHSSTGATTENITVTGTAAVPSDITYLGSIGSATIKDNSVDDLVITTTSAADAGNDIVLVYATDPAQDLVVNVSDEVGNTYNQIALAINQNQLRTYIFAAYNANSLPAGSDITISYVSSTTDAPAARAAVVGVFSNVEGIDLVDQTSTGENDNSTTASSGVTGSTIQSEELIIGAIGTEGPIGDTPGTWQNSFITGPRTGTSGDNDDTNITASMGYRIVSSIGTFTALKTGMTQRDHASAIATFRVVHIEQDELISDYDGSDGFSVSINHTDGDFISATSTSGTINSIHAYRVDNDANSVASIESGWFTDPLRYWGVRIFGTDNPTYTVVYNYENHPGIIDESSLNLASRTDPSEMTWALTSAVLDQDNNTLTLAGQTGTEYVLASQEGDNSLPVQLSSFSANAVEKGIEIKWITESQINNAGFEIWRKAEDATDFSLLSSYLNDPCLEGEGNSSMSHEYSYLDYNIEIGKKYIYKLSDVSYNGKYTYHETIEVQAEEFIPTKSTLLPNYPNPFNPRTTISYTVGAHRDVPLQHIDLSIYNLLGQKVATLVSEYQKSGKYKVEFDGFSLSSGIYFYRLQAGEFIQTRRMLLIK